MAVRGRKPKPTLQVIHEGNPGQRPLRDSVILAPSTLREPDWAELLPGDDARTRVTANTVWAKVAPVLTRSVGLVGEQQEVLVDYCVTWARIEQGERALSRQGVVVPTERGVVRNPWLIVLNQYRAHFRSLIGELGLSPSAVTRLHRPLEVDPDDPFDPPGT